MSLFFDKLATMAVLTRPKNSWATKKRATPTIRGKFTHANREAVAREIPGYTIRENGMMVREIPKWWRCKADRKAMKRDIVAMRNGDMSARGGAQ